MCRTPVALETIHSRVELSGGLRKPPDDDDTISIFELCDPAGETIGKSRFALRQSNPLQRATFMAGRPSAELKPVTVWT